RGDGSAAAGVMGGRVQIVTTGVVLRRPTPPPPLLLGGRGPKTLRLAGELADGVILHTRPSHDADHNVPWSIRVVRTAIPAARCWRYSGRRWWPRASRSTRSRTSCGRRVATSVLLACRWQPGRPACTSVWPAGTRPPTSRSTGGC